MIANPPVVVERLRKSTAAWGRGKFARVCAGSQGAMRVAWFTLGVAEMWEYRDAVGPDGVVRLEGWSSAGLTGKWRGSRGEREVLGA